MLLDDQVELDAHPGSDFQPVPGVSLPSTVDVSSVIQNAQLSCHSCDNFSILTAHITRTTLSASFLSNVERKLQVAKTVTATGTEYQWQ